MSDLYWLTDEQMERLRPFFPKSHGRPWVDDQRVLSGIIFVNRNGLRWRDAPKDYGPAKTLYNRWKRWGEAASNLWMPSQNPEAVRWQETIARFDGFVFVVAEYNHSITGVLKNALDQAFKEWNRKPFTAIGYGGVGAARAVEHLRLIGTELQMVSTRTAVHIGGGDFMTVHPLGANQPMEAIEGHLQASAKAALDELVWWAKATVAAKAAEA